MNDRIRKLREQSLDARPTITPERASLITEFYKSDLAEQVSSPMRRALAFKHLLGKKAVCINEGELIVGERGPAPKLTPTYPEVTAHSLEDLKILNTREKTSFSVDEETMNIYQKTIIPFWKGRSVRDRIFQQMTQEWKDSFAAGVYTEFMEQRAPGHTVLDDKIYKKGFLDFKQDIEKSIASLDFLNDSNALAKQEELKAMSISADALIRFAERHAEKARELSQAETDLKRKKELERIAE
ncbi:MAG: formate C-acetyltransferase/glycerol dehydratase family glycyl radical enzyme, partial [Candidatus Aminicenantes bacterium]|nr:formate C-acetyltransferase/glycerol dehydratase family glycyl radical enzyme [Candidatus Aminicenantes bacterium]